MVEIVLDSRIETTYERMTTLRLQVDPDLVEPLHQLGLSPLPLTLSPQDWVQQALTSPFIPEEIDVVTWLDCRDKLLNSGLPLPALAQALRPWVRRPIWITAGSLNPIYALRKRDRLGRLLRIVEEKVETHMPYLVRPGQWHLPGLGYEGRQRSNLEDIWASLCFVAGLPTQGSYQQDPMLQAASEHLAVAVGNSHLGRIPGWQTLDFFWRRGTHPYIAGKL